LKFSPVTQKKETDRKRGDKEKKTKDRVGGVMKKNGSLRNKTEGSVVQKTPLF